MARMLVMIISKTTRVLWVNAVLKRINAVLAKISPNLTQESKMEMRMLLSFISWNISPQIPSSELQRDPAVSLERKQL